MVMLKAWLESPLDTNGRFNVPDLGIVEVKPAKFEARDLTLVATSCDGTDVKADYSSKWQLMSDFLNLLLYSRLSLSKVIAARVEPDNCTVKVSHFVRLYRQIPTADTMAMPFGFPQTQRAIDRNVKPAGEPARAALTWLLKALRSEDAVDRMLYLWVALEAITPPIKSQPSCDKCRRDLACTHCGNPPATHRVVKAITQHLSEFANAKAISRLYALRSSVVHGKIGASAKEAERLAEQVMPLTVIAIKAVNRAMGWDPDRPSIKLLGSVNRDIYIDSEPIFETPEAVDQPILMNPRMVQFVV